MTPVTASSFLIIYQNQVPLELLTLEECSDNEFDNQQDCEGNNEIWGEVELPSFDTEENFNLLSVIINDTSLKIYINNIHRCMILFKFRGKFNF